MPQMDVGLAEGVRELMLGLKTRRQWGYGVSENYA